MSVSYDGKKIIPAPLASISRETVMLEDGTPNGFIYNIQLKGKLIAEKGSPNSSGDWHTGTGYPADESLAWDKRLRSILRKQEALLKLFANDGRSLEIQPWDGSAPFKCYPRIRSIDFPEGQWYEVCDYTIVMEADTVDGAAAGPVPPTISKYSDDWSIELTDENKRTYRVSHTVSATGRRLYAQDGTGDLLGGLKAWENARAFVQGRLGYNGDRVSGSSIPDRAGLINYNHAVSETINESAGTVSCTETWTAYNPGAGAAAIHEYTVSQRHSPIDGKVSATIDGTVTGLNSTGLPGSQFDNATAKWNEINANPTLFAIITNTTGLTNLNPTPTSWQVGRNPLTGTITYNYEFDNRASTWFPGALSETVSINDTFPSNVIAQIAVLGRLNGPVLQDTGTRTVRKRSISIEVQMPPLAYGSNPSSAASLYDGVNTIIATYTPFGYQVFVEDNQESWSPVTGRYTRNVSFIWEQ